MPLSLFMVQPDGPFRPDRGLTIGQYICLSVRPSVCPSVRKSVLSIYKQSVYLKFGCRYSVDLRHSRRYFNRVSNGTYCRATSPHGNKRVRPKTDTGLPFDSPLYIVFWTNRPHYWTARIKHTTLGWPLGCWQNTLESSKIHCAIVHQLKPCYLNQHARGYLGPNSYLPHVPHMGIFAFPEYHFW